MVAGEDCGDPCDRRGYLARKNRRLAASSTCYFCVSLSLTVVVRCQKTEKKVRTWYVDYSTSTRTTNNRESLTAPSKQEDGSRAYLVAVLAGFLDDHRPV